MRVGFGYDVHGFDDTRALVVGGVTIEGTRGLAGWSDADVLCHAIAGALLGAAGLGDLGTCFPQEAVPEGGSSLQILSLAAGMVGEAGFRIANVDCLVAIEQVKVAPHREEMERRIGSALGITAAAVNVKATTSDGLGFVGRSEGAAGMAVVLLEESDG